jgi:hypothetical protein
VKKANWHHTDEDRHHTDAAAISSQTIETVLIDKRVALLSLSLQTLALTKRGVYA